MALENQLSAVAEALQSVRAAIEEQNANQRALLDLFKAAITGCSLNNDGVQAPAEHAAELDPADLPCTGSTEAPRAAEVPPIEAYSEEAEQAPMEIETPKAEQAPMEIETPKAEQAPTEIEAPKAEQAPEVLTAKAEQVPAFNSIAEFAGAIRSTLGAAGLHPADDKAKAALRAIAQSYGADRMTEIDKKLWASALDALRAKVAEA